MSVEVFSWNPRRPVLRGPLGRMLPLRRRVNNFGDLLGPAIVSALLRERFGSEVALKSVVQAQLMSVGSVIHLARPGAVVWGSGVNGKVQHDYRGMSLDVRAVRGPRTRGILMDAGHNVPQVFGDPGLLLGELRPDLRERKARYGVTVVMNLNDPRPTTGHNILNPRASLEFCLETLASSELVVGSSLHGIIIAEALGIPARAVVSKAEAVFKYRDYFEGTGREFDPRFSVEDAVTSGGGAPPTWSSTALRDAFPFDLWKPRR